MPFAILALLATLVFVAIPVYRMIRTWRADASPDDGDVALVLEAFRVVYPDYRVARLEEGRLEVARGGRRVEVSLPAFVKAGSYGIDVASSATKAMDVVRAAVMVEQGPDERERAARALEEAAREIPGLDTSRVGEELLLDLRGHTVAILLRSLGTTFWGLPEGEWATVAEEELRTLLSLGTHGLLESEVLPCFLTPSRESAVGPETVRVRVAGLRYDVIFIRSSGLSAGYVDQDFVRRRGLTPSQVLAQARVGVDHLVPCREEVQGLVVIHSVDEDAAAAVLAVPQTLRGDDELAAVAPAHDTLLLWESDDFEAALEAQRRLDQFDGAEAPIPEPIVITSAGIEPISWGELDGSAVD
ncbi:MAG: hypothetical protein JJ863_12225 [Deltaproteobacteria bacterium]|nr:hypothetical protein [Deltaproteobacteria bacterium]